MNKALAETCLRYLDSDLALEELQAFNQLLAESPEAADLLAQLALDEQHYRATPAGSEEEFLPDLLNLEVADHSFSLGTNATRSTKSILGDSGFWVYLAGSALRSTPAKWVAVAAMVILATILVFVFTDGRSGIPQAPNLAGTASEPDGVSPGPAGPGIVATLTAEHGAAWAEGVLAVSSALRAGQRLTLTEGFAEIVTRRGAVVVLQAPASIELFENDNAVHLHAGKLVGICPTKSSNGFVVKTDHATITDIGTEFGVDVGTDGTTHVQVFVGEVQAEGDLTSDTPAVPLMLLKKDAAVIRPGMQPQRVAFMAGRYDQVLAIARSSPLPVLTKVARLGPLPVRLLSGAREMDALQVYVERRGFTLESDLPVNLERAGGQIVYDLSKAPTVPAGSRVDVFLLHADPIDDARQMSRGEFVVRFDRPILGVIGYSSALSRSNEIFRLDSTSYPADHESNGLEPGETDDHFEIDPDGQTLRLNLVVGKEFIDQLRVLVQAEGEDG